MKIKKKKNIVFYSFFILTGISMIIPYAIFSLYELDYAMNIGWRYNVLILIFAVTFYIIYKQKLFLIKSNNKLFKPLIEIFLLVFGIFIIWMFSLSLIAGMFLIFNTTFGKQKTIYVKSIVKNTDITKSKNGTIHYYITVNIPDVNRKVKLKVKREYEINEVYTDTLKLGSLNMIYKFK